jgi:hypothetical protein
MDLGDQVWLTKQLMKGLQQRSRVEMSESSEYSRRSLSLDISADDQGHTLLDSTENSGEVIIR